jgi:hypothetical protein
VIADEENVGDVWWNGPLRFVALSAEDYIPTAATDGDLRGFTLEWFDPAIGQPAFELDVPVVIARVNTH